MTAMTEIEIHKQDMKFSAAHFTVFSATERERLHGHNFAVRASVRAPVGDDGMCFSYAELKTRLRDYCAALDEYLLLPERSPHLTVEAVDEYYRVHFAGEVMTFLQRDTRLLPIRNTTVEEFSAYLLQCLLDDREFVRAHGIQAIRIRVSSGPGQSGSAEWRAEP